MVFNRPLPVANNRFGSRAVESITGPSDGRMSAEQIHSRFKARPGSEHIASAEAIARLQNIVRTYHPRSVLEIGSGIGTLRLRIVDTYRALGLDDYQFVTVENNAFCAQQLRANLARELHHLRMIDDIGGLADDRFDLIIVDGGADRDGRVVELLAAGGIVFVEGFRASQRCLIARLTRSYAVANIRSMQQTNSHRPSSSWGGAYWLFKFEPGPSTLPPSPSPGTTSDTARFIK
jgi:predicted O-methyltransferase YrrM